MDSGDYMIVKMGVITLSYARHAIWVGSDFSPHFLQVSLVIFGLFWTHLLLLLLLLLYISASPHMHILKYLASGWHIRYFEEYKTEGSWVDSQRGRVSSRQQNI